MTTPDDTLKNSANFDTSPGHIEKEAEMRCDETWERLRDEAAKEIEGTDGFDFARGARWALQSQLVRDMECVLDDLASECASHIDMLSENGVSVAVSQLSRAKHVLADLKKARGDNG